LIDPNIDSSGSVPAHGFMELSHPEPGSFMVGMKAYGRALAGDLDAASRVELVLSQSGSCGLGSAQSKAEGVPQPEAVPAEVVGCCA